MNYPSSVVNPAYSKAPVPNNNNPPHLENLYHVRSRANSAYNGSFKKPFQIYNEMNNTVI